MKLLGLDFETTGVDPATCRPIEFGCQFYDTETRVRSGDLSQLIWEASYPDLEPEIEEITGITTEEAKRGQTVEALLHTVAPLVEKSDVLVAYNAVYDRLVLERCFLHVGLPVIEKPWMCAFSEWPYPKRYMKCKQLSHRAFDHGITVGANQAHRALGDVKLMFDILDRYGVADVLRYWQEPWVYLKAEIPFPWTDGGKGRDWAKSQGFGWEQAPGDFVKKFEKKWVRRLKASEFAALQIDIPSGYQINKII